MAIAVQLDFTGGTLAQYDQTVQKMGLRSGGPGGPGALFHWVTKTADGIRVIDVWTSKEAFETYAKDKIGPITQETGLPQPNMQFFEVHSFMTAG